jgi:hypothetical protein
MPVSELDKIPRNAGNYFGSVCVYGDVVFDPNSPDACNVYPRFDSNHVSRHEALLLPRSNTRIFVHFKSEPMARTMREVAVQAVACQDLSRRGVHIPARGSVFDCRDRCFLRFEHRSVQPPDARRRPP